MNIVEAYVRDQFEIFEVGPALFIHGMGRANLAELFRRFGHLTGAEVGVHKGEYSETLCKANMKLNLLCVDHWKHPEFYEEARARLAPYHCKLMKMESLDAAACVEPESLDFVYIDGNHLYNPFKRDLEAWEPKVKVGGIVAGHDYHNLKPSRCQVIKGINEWILARGIQPLFVTDPEAETNRANSWFYYKEN